ncbi:MAG: hypothetical protein BMS9Abin17_0763 [Acidimicrobiia bacterium]|nr:MAG: hypothetical protein BMS9Abin17_0763 [Acidimicrobiia bacterium]
MNVIVYTRQACPLCADGISKATEVFGTDHVSLIDVDLDLDLLERYTDRVPVIETEDGTVIDEGLIDYQTLKSYHALRNT